MTDQLDHNNGDRDTELSHEQLSLDTYETEIEDEDTNESELPSLETTGELLTDLESLTGKVHMTAEDWSELSPETRARMVETRLSLLRDRIEDEQTQGVDEHAYAYYR